jgi:hypothetical protein
MAQILEELIIIVPNILIRPTPDLNPHQKGLDAMQTCVDQPNLAQT